MSKRLVTCQWCKIKDTPKDEMMFEMTNGKKPIRKNYHKHCWEDYLKHKEFLTEEQRKKDELNEVLKEIYGVKEIPNSAWVLLEKLRGGNPIFGKQQQVTKRYKEGYDYSLIKETFEYCSDTIEYHNRTKTFNGFMGAFKYALAIIIDKIYVVEQRVKNREKQQLLIEKHIENVDVEEHVFETTYRKPKKSKADISDFLDD